MKLTKFLSVAVTAGVLSLSLGACSTDSGAEKSPAQKNDKLTIVATTGYLGDAIANIAPDADVTVLVGPGGDPHTQALTTKDSERIEKADLVVWTSHDMEHKMMDHFDKLGERQLPAGEAIPESDLLPWEEDGKIEGHDPHIWNSPDNWIIVVEAINKKLQSIDKDHADIYETNAKKYVSAIREAKDKAGKLLEKIPADRRILITGHDAFNYLGKTYNIQIRATDFVSSESEISASQLDELAAFIAEKKVPVIFQDNLKNPAAIKHLQEAVEARGWNVKVSDEVLYADSLGETAPLDTYLGAFTHNAEVISAALGSK